MILCSCKCPTDSTNPKCQDPNQVPIKKQYALELDGLGRVVLKVTDGSNITYKLVTTMSNLPTQPAQSQFIGTSSSGFTGVLDAPDSFFQQLGLIPCFFNSSGACETFASENSRRSSAQIYDLYMDPKNEKKLAEILFAGPAALHSRGRQRMLIQSADMSADAYQLLGTLDDSSVSGVQSPLICLKAGQGVMWSVSSAAGTSHYPQYVPDSLFNTNPNFDYGALLSLQKDVQAGRPVSSFFQEFSTSGIYVFEDGGDESKQTVIGVVDPLADCPVAFEKNPIQVMSVDILQDFPSGNNPAVIAPDYSLIVGIGVTIGAMLVCSLGCLYLRRMVGWGRLQLHTRSYREKQRKGKEDLHSMASKRQISRLAGSAPNRLLDELDDQAAGYVDLEGFNVQTLFDKLQDQTNLVTEQLTKQKDDVREFYDKVERTLSGKMGGVEKEDLSAQDRRARRRQRRVEDELLRRKRLGSDQLALASKQNEAGNSIRRSQAVPDIAAFDQKFVQFISQVLATAHLSDAATIMSQIQKDKVTFEGELKLIVNHVRNLPDIVLGAGAELVSGSEEMDPVLNLPIPCRGAQIKMGNIGEPIPIPPNCFIHPQSRQVMPMEGNIWYDMLNGRFCVGSQLSLESVRAGPLPYICNVVLDNGDCYPPASAPYAHLLSHENWWPIGEDRSIFDSFTGLRVPAIGVTCDPRNGKLALVGGSMIDPETRLLKPIEMYDFVEDLKSRELGFVLGVTLDRESLKVVPVFGRLSFIFSLSVFDF